MPSQFCSLENVYLCHLVTGLLTDRLVPCNEPDCEGTSVSFHLRSGTDTEYKT
jgi:hypothetical protein